MRLPWLQHPVDGEALGLLPGVVDPQGPHVPVADERCLVCGDERWAPVDALYGRVAPHVIAVAVSVDEQVHPLALQAVLQQRERASLRA